MTALHGDPTRRDTAIIFRKRLLPWSETFIAAQGGALERYRPVYAGYRLEEGGAEYLAGADTVVLEDHAAVPPLGKLVLKAFGRVAPGWREALASRQPVVVHAHFGVNALEADALARAFRIPLVVTYHGVDIAVEAGPLQRRQRRRVFERADRIIAVSDFIAGRLRAAGVPEAKLVVHHIGVDTDHFSPGDETPAPTRVLFAGRLVRKKGVAHLLAAMRTVQRNLPAAELVIAGDGPLRESLEAQARELDVNVRFLGVRTPVEVRDLMRQSAVFCAPGVVTEAGNAEGLPMTIAEAQACGLPVVTFPSGGSAEGVRHGETGYVAPSRDEEALAEYIGELLGDEARRQRFSRAARAWALAEFDLRTQTRRLEDIYDDARRAYRA